MKCYVYKDDSYLCGIDTSVHRKDEFVEIPDELYERYLETSRAFFEMQEELEKYSCE